MFSTPGPITHDLDTLPISEIHRRRLQWFLDHEGKIVPWRQIAAVREPQLTSLPKGIYKPLGWEYSLSIKETLNSPYGDIPIMTLSNGDWVYQYHREDGQNLHTNRGLLLCQRDGIPVGVLIQVEPKPNVKYFVAGLGRITHFSDPWFDLVNWRSAEIDASMSRLAAEESPIFDYGQDQAQLPGFFTTPEDDKYGKQLMRPNQQMFRVMLLNTYEHTCAVTSSKVVQALDAAHIRPYSNKRMDTANNGLLLRADVHRLFDNGLIGVETDHMEAVLSPRLIGTEYEEFEGRAITIPSDPGVQPSPALLDEHRGIWKLG